MTIQAGAANIWRQCGRQMALHESWCSSGVRQPLHISMHAVSQQRLWRCRTPPTCRCGRARTTASPARTNTWCVRTDGLPNRFRPSNGLQCWYAALFSDAVDVRCTQAKFLKKFEGIAAAQLGGEGAAESKGQ